MQVLWWWSRLEMTLTTPPPTGLLAAIQHLPWRPWGVTVSVPLTVILASLLTLLHQAAKAAARWQFFQLLTLGLPSLLARVMHIIQALVWQPHLFRELQH